MKEKRRCISRLFSYIDRNSEKKCIYIYDKIDTNKTGGLRMEKTQKELEAEINGDERYVRLSGIYKITLADVKNYRLEGLICGLRSR